MRCSAVAPLTAYTTRFIRLADQCCILLVLNYTNIMNDMQLLIIYHHTQMKGRRYLGLVNRFVSSMMMVSCCQCCVLVGLVFLWHFVGIPYTMLYVCIYVRERERASIVYSIPYTQSYSKPQVLNILLTECLQHTTCYLSTSTCLTYYFTCFLRLS